jgi:uncharacterized protein with PQ loop repeat
MILDPSFANANTRYPRVHLISGRWRSRETNQITPTYLNTSKISNSCLQFLWTAPHSTMNIINKTYQSSQGRNEHATLVTITKQKEVRFSIRVLLMPTQSILVYIQLADGGDHEKTNQITPIYLNISKISNCVFTFYELLHAQQWT